MKHLMKRLFLAVAVVALMLSFPIPAMAQDCDIWDISCWLNSIPSEHSYPSQQAAPVQQYDTSGGDFQSSGPVFTNVPADTPPITKTITPPPPCATPPDCSIDYGGGGNSDDPNASLDVR